MPRPAFAGIRLTFLAALPLLTALAACGGGGLDSTPTPSPTPPPTPAGSPTPTPAAPDTPYRLVYRESGQKEDIIWRIVPSDPAQREKLATLGHREGFGVVASLSPDGRLLAYLTLPDSARSPESSEAEAHIVDLKTQKSTLIAGDIDYQFRPLWSPDGQLLFLRKYAGPEILSSDVTILYTRVTRAPLEGEATPTPTPTPAPGVTPAPTLPPDEPLKTILQAKYSQVLAFVPLGFGPDRQSLYFVQVNGGTQSTALVASYAPATTAAIDAARASAEAAFRALIAAWAAANANLPPDVTPAPQPTPQPTPSPSAKFIVQLTEQEAEDFELSPDSNKVVFRAGGLLEGQFVNQVFFADLVAAGVQTVPAQGLPAGDLLNPIWHPDSQHVTVGVPVHGGLPGEVAVVPLAGGAPQFLPPAAGGFDVPRAWSPDGVFLAVTHFTGDSLANQGDGSLELVAPTGQRVPVATGAGYAGDEAVIGWSKPG